MSRLEEDLKHLPELPPKIDYGIGAIGAGFIMRDVQLPSYRKAGMNVVAIASRTKENAQQAAEQNGVAKVYDSWRELLDDPAVVIVDIAYPPDQQLEIVREVVKHADHVKGVLAQKPLALTVADAKNLVERCRAAGVVLAVNQNMRFDQSVRAAKDVLTRGWLGDPVLATIDMRAIPHWMPWARGLPSLATFVMSIHHLDTFRYWLGTPDRVLASTRPDPRTKFPHRDGINLYILEYDRGLRACSWDDVWAGPALEGAAADTYIRWRVEGTDGLAQGTIGWPAYPARVPSTLDFTTKRHAGWQQPRWPEVWFPDAFVGTMAQLLCALEDGTEPEISGRDNLETIALCEAVFAAARDHRVTTVREFLN